MELWSIASRIVGTGQRIDVERKRKREKGRKLIEQKMIKRKHRRMLQQVYSRVINVGLFSIMHSLEKR